MTVEQFDELGKVSERARQAIDLVDDYDVDLSRLNVSQQTLESWSIGRTAGEAAVIVAIADQGPGRMDLASNVGFRSFVLGVERVEVLVESQFRGDAGVDRTTNGLRWVQSSSSDFFGWFVTEAEEPRAIPVCAGDREGNFRQTWINFIIPRKSSGQHHDPMRLTGPFADQHGTGS